MIIYSINDEFQSFLDRCENESAPRGLKVRESLFESLDLIPTLPIANFEARPFNFKYFCGELAWYLNQDNDITYISKFSNFWKNITNPGTNEINSNYGTLLFGKQLQWVYESLVKDPNSRQAIAFLNQPKFQFEGNKDFVCTMYLNFFIRENALHMKVQMRSNDIFYGLTYDAPFFSFVMQHVYLWLKPHYPDLQLGGYFHYADNMHYYEPHFELAEKIIESDVSETDKYRFELTEAFFTIENDQLKLTSHGVNFINEVNTLIEQDGNKQVDWSNLLSRYAKI
jgi:thymidylate synthase